MAVRSCAAFVPLVFPFHFSVGGFRSMRPLALAAWAALRAMPARSFGDSTLARRYPPIRPARAFMALRARPSGVWCARISAWRSSSGRCLKGSVNRLLLVTQPVQPGAAVLRSAAAREGERRFVLRGRTAAGIFASPVSDGNSAGLMVSVRLPIARGGSAARRENTIRR